MRLACLLLLCVMLPASLTAQSLLDRTPNVSGGWVGTPGTIYFHFLHRFESSGPPTRQVINYPTFLLAYSPFSRSLFGVHYATRSDIAPRFPNEYELFARYSAWRFLSLQAGYNHAAESVDGELGITHSMGPVRLLGAARMFSNALATDTARFALAGGATVRLSRWFALAGDYAQIIDTDEDAAWSAALQIAIPYTPHTLSLQAANTNTATLQGATRGSSDVRYGFEFTIPFTPARYFARNRASAGSTEAARDSIVVDMRAVQFVPAAVRVRAGSAVIWRNGDQLAHTVTALDNSWTSPLLDPGQTYRRVFGNPGRFDITCTPHPFMKMVVEVVP
ncbi:MAG TPA: plastocyanin/azurin family copper-binding protein [Longimicrobiales bacterium]